MNSKTGTEPESGLGVLSKQGGLQKDGLSRKILQTRRSKTDQANGTEKVQAQYPDNQRIVNGWASGIQEPTNKKG
jgi:hypothetical protein